MKRKKIFLSKNLKEKFKKKSLIESDKNVQEDSNHTNSECEQFEDSYVRNIEKIKSIHEKLLTELRIQKRSRGKQFNFLKSKNYFIFSSNSNVVQINRDGKKLKRTHLEPKHPLRMTFFNGGKAHFPYDIWNDIFRLRSVDICNKILLFDNEIAHSDEGIKLFFELDYRSKKEVPCNETILKHIYVLIDVVRQYYRKLEHKLDFSTWVLLSSPKPKYVNDELYPIIAMGCHLIFRNIVVNCEQAKQICHSANLQLESQYGIKNVVDIACYKNCTATLRPIYCRKLEVCFYCLNDDDLRLNCEKCFCRGKTPSGSIYTPSYLIDNDGNSFFSKSELESYVTNDMEKIIKETSIIPSKKYMFTNGFCIPDGFCHYIPNEFRSKHKEDINKNYIFKQDRNVIGRRKNISKITDEFCLKRIREIVMDYHGAYKHDTMLLSSVSTNDDKIFVDLKGYGRSFCRVKHENGTNHKSNRIFFILCMKNYTITQFCYDNDCKKEINSNQTVKKRLTQSISNTRLIGMKEFLKIKEKKNIGDKFDNMLKFLYS